METKIVIETCPVCGTEYELGITGVVSGCDICLKIERDIFGFPWYPGEEVHIHQDLYGSEYLVIREEVFEK